MKKTRQTHDQVFNRDDTWSKILTMSSRMVNSIYYYWRWALSNSVIGIGIERCKEWTLQMLVE